MKSPLRVWLTVGPVALAVGGGALATVLTSGHEENRILVSIFGLIVGWSFVVAGLIALTRRPENRTGILLLVVGFTFFVGALGDSNNSILFTTGIAFGAIFIAALIHLLLAYPSGRATASRRERILVISGYVAAFLANFAPMLFDRKPFAEDCTECPDNALLITNSPTTDDVLTVIFDRLGFVVIALTVVLLVRRWRRSSPAARRLLEPVLIAGGTTLFFFALTIVVFPLSETAANVIGIGFVAGFIATPFVFLWDPAHPADAAGRGRAACRTRTRRRRSSRRRTRSATRSAIPAELLVYRLDDPAGHFKVDGGRVRLEEVDEGRAVTHIESTDGPIAAIIHDPALLAEPELLAADRRPGTAPGGVVAVRYGSASTAAARC